MALTFIRLLVRDLSKSLALHADAMTLHGFCHYWLHQWPATGLSARFRFYPRLLALLAKDLGTLGFGAFSEDDLERDLQSLITSGATEETLRLASYYDATSFIDVIYRTSKYLTVHPDRIPSYPLVVVDEYQDFTLLETTLIEQLGEISRLLVAGDDDQSLYSFRHASPGFIRALARGFDYQSFPLPYCSRCPEVIVRAVLAVIERAVGIGLMSDRLDKPYVCYLPTKADDSLRYPRIIDVRVSVQNGRYPFMSHYIADQIAHIPPEEIAESRKEGFPTVLIVGRKEFLGQVHRQLKQVFGYSQIEYRRSRKHRVRVLDGYRILADDEAANLGWRIVIDVSPPDSPELVLERALTTREALVRHLDPEYIARHLAVANLVGELIDGRELTAPQQRILVIATGETIKSISAELLIPLDDPGAPVEADDAGGAEIGEEALASQPTIVCASLVGAKGLSAQHVFVVGMSNGYFPDDARHITEDEVSQLIVALSRTRKECQLLSCRVWTGTAPLSPSIFLGWLGALTERREVNAASWK